MSKVIAFRLNDKQLADVREVARRYGWSTGQTCRFLAMRGLGIHASDAAADQAVWSVLSKLRGEQAQINAEIAEVVRESVGPEVAEGFERAARHRVDFNRVVGDDGFGGAPEPEEDNVVDFEGFRRGKRRRRGRRGGRGRR